MNRLANITLTQSRNSSKYMFNATRALSVEGSFKKKGTAIEEEYFRKLAEKERKDFAEKLHQKELKTLIAILPENHGLSPKVLHDILEWKHKD